MWAVRYNQTGPQHSTARHSTAQHSTAQHSTAQHSTAHPHTRRHAGTHPERAAAIAVKPKRVLEEAVDKRHLHSDIHQCRRCWRCWRRSIGVTLERVFAERCNPGVGVEVAVGVEALAACRIQTPGLLGTAAGSQGGGCIGYAWLWLVSCAGAVRHTVVRWRAMHACCHSAPKTTHVRFALQCSPLRSPPPPPPPHQRTFIASASQKGKPASWPQPGRRSQWPPFGPWLSFARHLPLHSELLCMVHCTGDGGGGGDGDGGGCGGATVTGTLHPAHFSWSLFAPSWVLTVLSHAAARDVIPTTPVPPPTKDAACNAMTS